MKRYDVIKLLSEDPKAHGVFDDPDEPGREVMCEVRSVGMTSYYQGYSNGLNPTYVFVLAQPEEYKGEKIVEYQKARYQVIRSFINKGDAVELTVEPATFDNRGDDYE